jgi:dTDP-4-dehydrorhamnose 3,5-epimerase
MKIVPTKLDGCFVLEPTIYGDERGHFFESYNSKTFRKLANLDINFVQDNQSSSNFGVIRGLHFQTGDHAQAKLVRVLSGEILDVAVDLRKDSSTYGQHVSIRLNSDNRNQLFVPKGFAHGFSVLSKRAEVMYKCDNYYDMGSESGIIYNDATLNIDWKLELSDIIVSSKDENLGVFSNVKLEI